MTEFEWFDAGGRLTAEVSPNLLANAGSCAMLVKAALHHDNGAAAIAALDDAGILSRSIPEIEPMRDCGQNEFHHKPVLAHTFEAMDNLDRFIQNPGEVSPGYGKRIIESLNSLLDGMDARAVLRLAMLLHDVEKPSTKAAGKDGRITFHKHDTLGAESAVSITKRLPGFGQAAGSIEKLIKHHMLLGFMAREETPNQKSILRFIKKLEHLTPLEILLSISDRLAARGPKVEDENIRRHFAGAEAILKAYFEPPDVYVPLITGAEVMKITGIPEGPRVGVIMNMLKNAEIRGEIKTKEEAIRRLIQLRNARNQDESI